MGGISVAERSSSNYQRDLDKLVLKVFRQVSAREDAADFRPKLDSLREALNAGRSVQLGNSFQGLFHTHIVTEQDLERLRTEFYITLRDDRKEGVAAIDSPTVSVFEDIIPALIDYISLRYDRKIDYGHYNPTVEGSTFFTKQLDSRIARVGTTWNLEVERSNFEVRPPQNVDELYGFMNADSRYCFFDFRRNLAQLYLYAAHQNVRLLGIWEKSSEGDIPRGLVPMLMMRQPEGRIPFLSVEFPLMEESGNEMEWLVKKKVHLQNGKEVHFYDALVDIILIYSLLNQESPIPIIGSCRKNDNGYYNHIFRGFTESAARNFNFPRWFPFQNRIAIEEYSQRGTERTRTRARIEGEMELELIPDDTLLKYLQKEAGYRFPEIMMFTQDFIGDKQRTRTNLYNDWGVMHGRTQVMPIKEFFRIKAEQEG